MPRQQRRCAIVGSGWNGSGLAGVDAVWSALISATADPSTEFAVDWPATLGARPARRLPLAAKLAVLAAREAIPLWFTKMSYPGPDIALVTTPVTTTSIAARAGATFEHGRTPPANLSAQLSSTAAASAVGRDLQIAGPTFCIEAACASSAVAVAHAAGMIETLAVRVAVAGGADVQIDLGSDELDLIQSVFSAMRIVDPTGRAAPFAAAANGMVSGQGAAFVTLADSASLPADVAPAAVVSGWATNFEAAAEFSSAPDGSAVALVIRKALEHAEVRPEDEAAVIAHGTGTIANDTAEAAGIRQVLGSDVPVTSIKGHLGHAAYAAGAMNVVAACQTLRTGVLPGLRRDTSPDPKHRINLVVGPTRIERGPVVCIALGLGGFNTALVISPP